MISGALINASTSCSDKSLGKARPILGIDGLQQDYHL
jgi:hypothetical protein